MNAAQRPQPPTNETKWASYYLKIYRAGHLTMDRAVFSGKQQWEGPIFVLLWCKGSHIGSSLVIYRASMFFSVYVLELRTINCF